jgi:opacity protein-like surface antigen
LLYATAGIAFLGYDKDIDDLFADGDLGLDDPVVGLVVGAGIEYKFSANLSAGLEGL